MTQLKVKTSKQINEDSQRQRWREACAKLIAEINGIDSCLLFEEHSAPLWWHCMLTIKRVILFVNAIEGKDSRSALEHLQEARHAVESLIDRVIGRLQ